MKKIVKLGFVVALVVVMLAQVAFAAEYNLSGFTFDELIELQKQVTLAIMESDGWQEVEVPMGIYTVGEEIPEGKWVVERNKKYSAVYVDDYEQLVMLESDGEIGVIEAKKGHKISVEYGTAIFKPYTGSLGFK